MPVTILNFINGELVPSRGPRTAPVYNPATGEQSATLGLATTQDVRSAAAAARKAFPLPPRKAFPGLGEHTATAPCSYSQPFPADHGGSNR
ncbi:hypothetical protein ACVWZ6_000255 [Bradyrhizobium sp. GM6.1]